MPVFSAIHAASFVAAPRDFTSALRVDDGRTVAILAGRRGDGPEA